jgi:hypothetical protein
MTLLDSLLFANFAHQSSLELLPGGVSALGLSLASAQHPPQRQWLLRLRRASKLEARIAMSTGTGVKRVNRDRYICAPESFDSASHCLSDFTSGERFRHAAPQK